MPGKVGPVNTSCLSAARWLTRVVFVVLVLGGVLLMHTLVAQPGAGGEPAARGDTAVMSMSEHGGSEGPARHCDSGDCPDHSAMHLCVAMLAAVGTALVLMLLSLIVRGEFGGRARNLLTGRIQGRAPPWSHLSLEKLSVLRL